MRFLPLVLLALTVAPAQAARKPRKHHPAPRKAHRAAKAQPAPRYDPAAVPPSEVLGGSRQPRTQFQGYTLYFSDQLTARDRQRSGN